MASKNEKIPTFLGCPRISWPKLTYLHGSFNSFSQNLTGYSTEFEESELIPLIIETLNYENDDSKFKFLTLTVEPYVIIKREHESFSTWGPVFSIIQTAADVSNR